MTDKKNKIQSIIKSLSNGWHSEERETSILFDHHDQVVYLETSEPYTARRWFSILSNDQNVKFDERADTLKITVPWEYCRKAELILMAKHRKLGASPASHKQMSANQPLVGT